MFVVFCGLALANRGLEWEPTNEERSLRQMRSLRSIINELEFEARDAAMDAAIANQPAGPEEVEKFTDCHCLTDSMSTGLNCNQYSTKSTCEAGVHFSSWNSRPLPEYECAWAKIREIWVGGEALRTDGIELCDTAPAPASRSARSTPMEARLGRLVDLLARDAPTTSSTNPASKYEYAPALELEDDEPACGQELCSDEDKNGVSYPIAERWKDWPASDVVFHKCIWKGAEQCGQCIGVKFFGQPIEDYCLSKSRKISAGGLFSGIHI